jgi:hypothetical protein
MLVLLLRIIMEKKPTFGSLIDLIVRTAQTSANQKVTEFIGQLVNGSISARQVSRMRKYTGFPDEGSLLKLIKVLPDVDLLNPETIPTRLLLPWSAIERDQAKLADNTSITIVSGWEPPKATYKQNIAKSIAIKISKGFSYTFVYPDCETYVGGDKEEAKKVIEGWMDDVRKKVSLEWDRYITWEVNKASENINFKSSIVEDTDKYIGAVNTNRQGNFWFNLPSPYCVFYNLGLKDRDPSSRHGVFDVKGLLLPDVKRGADRNDVFSEGWLLTTEEQFQAIEESFISDTPKWRKYIRKTS